MKELNRLMIEIIEITEELESEYPEVYQFLDENSITLPGEGNPNIDKQTMKTYLSELKEILKKYKASRGKKEEVHHEGFEQGR